MEYLEQLVLIFKNKTVYPKPYKFNLNYNSMKKYMKFFAYFLLASTIFYSCKKDNLTQEDVIKNQQVIDFVVQVLDRTDFNKPVDSANVTTYVNGEMKQVATDVTGTVTFKDVKVGTTLSLYITKNNYLNAYSEAEAYTSNYRVAEVSQTVYLYSTKSSNLVTIKGRLTLEKDVTNREPEPASNVVVKAMNSNLNDYAEQYFYDVTDTNGNYEIKVPVTSTNSNYVEVFYPEITTNQSFAKMLNDGSVQIVERKVLYKSNSGGLTVPSVPSAFITIAAPDAGNIGTGFELDSKANPTYLSNYSDAIIVTGGSGFFGGKDTANVRFKMTPGMNGDTAEIQVDITAGKISNFDYFINNGALYNSKPSVVFAGGGTGAQIDIQFATTYNIFIANSGSNYLNYPTVSAEVLRYYSNTLINYVDNDINDYSNTVLGAYHILGANTQINNGKIESTTGNGDTIYVTGYELAEKPVLTVNASEELKTAHALIYSNYISSSDSSITSYNLVDAGNGYDPANPPTVTVYSVDGHGDGALFKAQVNTSHQVSNLILMNGGKAYVRNLNDFLSSGTTSNYNQNPSYPSTYFYPKMGETIVQDVNYGTGYQVITPETEK